MDTDAQVEALPVDSTAPAAMDLAPDTEPKEALAAAQEGAASDAPKRRGRPAKKAAAPPPAASAQDHPQAEKRGRGRPKGSAQAGAKRKEGEAELSEEEAPKKARTDSGRPVKVAPAAALSILGRHPSHGQTGGTVLTFGMGENDQLGYEAEERKKPKVVDRLPASAVRQVCCGGLHTAVVSMDGKVFTFGVNDEGALGRGGAEADVAPMGGHVGSKVAVQVACGDSHTMVLCDDGSVWGCGIYRDAQGKMGFSVAHGSGVVAAVAEQVAPGCTSDPYVRIVGGVDHTLALTQHGHLYSWGCGEQGRLGRLGRVSDRHRLQAYLKPSPVVLRLTSRTKAEGRRIVDVAAGAYHSFAIIADGSVYAWGASMSGQTGLVGARNVAMPERVDSLAGRHIVAMAAGNHHSLALDSKGRVWSAGKGTGGVLGTGSEQHSLEGTDEDSPNRWFEVGGALAGQKVAAVACGSECSYALTADGALYAWGFGENMQLGTGKDEPELAPVRVDGEQLKDRTVLQVSAGGQHVALLACP